MEKRPGGPFSTVGRFREGLPRPAEARRLEGPAAAFVGLSAAERQLVATSARIESALSRLSAGLPGEREPAARAAVLLALGWQEEGSGVKLLVIRRAVGLRSNPGEIAFPGGAREPHEGIVEAALREAHEEVGLDPAAVRLVGRLPAVSQHSRPGEIAPVVGLVAGSPRLLVNRAEVEETFLIELAQLFDPHLYWEEEWAPGEEESWRMHFFDRGEDVIWGLSARILVSFLEALAVEARYARSPGKSRES